MAKHPGLTRWHAYMEGGSNPAVLADMLADDAVFHSPVVHTPQAGKAKVMAYLGAAGGVFGNGTFEYVREIADGDNVILEFTAEMDGIMVNGIDMIQFNADGKIQDFKVMVRPLKAINKVWDMMAAQLAAAKG
ncbi:nuclear transport factor 2 family protein [Novosphingobium sp.]|uniref:nuclear transport factor 2 family protein n=1 Tax=Novosphingobium sp. TaxID=1874826 RepID=UPI0027368508|nr:nuclear transport factor 2 family protein [Novosphingobium sp.]MDP3906265.1 nuclear transport factor 2 family protein [Novosphingobium sp.]